MIVDHTHTLCYKGGHLALGGFLPSPYLRSRCPWLRLAAPCSFCRGHNSSVVSDTPPVWRGYPDCLLVVHLLSDFFAPQGRVYHVCHTVHPMAFAVCCKPYSLAGLRPVRHRQPGATEGQNDLGDSLHHRPNLF